MATPAAKTCTKCGAEKALEEFQPNPNGRFGRKSTCRECNRAATRKWKQENPQKRLEQKRRSWDRHKDRLNEVRRAPEKRERANALRREAYHDGRRQFSAPDPVKRYARFQVWKAVQEGDLVREPCVTCGALNSQGHHEDYSKPLDIVWLCAKCHSALHREGVAA
jgi:hypothetical protein